MQNKACEKEIMWKGGRKLNLTQNIPQTRRNGSHESQVLRKNSLFHHSKDNFFWPNLCYKFTDICIQFTTSDKTVHAIHFITYNYLHVERLAVLVTRPSIEILFHSTIYKWNMWLSWWQDRPLKYYFTQLFTSGTCGCPSDKTVH